MIISTLILAELLFQKPKPDFTWVASVEYRWTPVDTADPSEVHSYEETGSATRTATGFKIARSRVATQWEVGGEKLPVPENPNPILSSEAWSSKELNVWVDEPEDIPSRILLRLSYAPLGVMSSETWEMREATAGLAEMKWSFRRGTGTNHLQRPAQTVLSSFEVKAGGKGKSTLTYDTKSGLPLLIHFKGERLNMPFGDGSPFYHEYQWKVTTFEEKQ